MISFHQISTECGTWVLTPPAELCPDCARYVRDQGPEGCFKWRTLVHQSLGSTCIVYSGAFLCFGCAFTWHEGKKWDCKEYHHAKWQKMMGRKWRKRSWAMQRIGYICPLRGFNYVHNIKWEKTCLSTKSLWVFWPINSHLERAKGEKYQMQIQQEAKQGERTK